MAFGDRFKKPSTTEQTTPATGKISLAKGERVTLTKTSDPIVAKNGWTAKGKDYDLKALVRYRDGRQVYVGAANADEVLRTQEGAVVHGGDARKAGKLETVTITWHADIASVALSSYSAIENGTGSFRKYGVYVSIENGPQTVEIAAADTSAKGTSYTLCFGEVIFNADGSLTVVNREEYSARGSENRIAYQGDRVVMDAGPIGHTK